MARRDLYEVLGVPRDADADAIKKAYRKLARQLHPDVNPGDGAAEERFKEVSEAYAVLSDAAKKRDYDEFGDVSLEGGFDAEAARRAREAFGARFGPGGAAGRSGGFEAFFGPGGEEMHFGGDLEDLLSRLGGRGRPSGPRRGADLEAELELELREAALGCERRLSLARPTANGPRTESVTVKVPRGMVDGARIRIPGKGADGVGGGPAGDLHATIRVRPDALFRAEGRDLYIDLPVSFAEATLGAEVEVPTLDGRATLTLPSGTDGGKRLRLRGKGIPGVGRHAAGDLYGTVRIQVPHELDAEGRRRVEAVAELGPLDPRRGLS